MKKRVADIVMDILVEHGIVDCFAVVGGGAMHLDNALALNEKINKYFNHHEQACAMAADAYARLSGKMAAVCVTSGPGSSNTLTGVIGAWQDSLPMIVLSGQVRYEISIAKSGLPLRYRGIQEFNIIPTVQNMTKYAVMITEPHSIKQEMTKAIQIAMDGRRGPVWLDIPQDIQNAVVETEHLYPVEKFISALKKPMQEDMVEIIKLLQQAECPCILAGSGIRSSDTMSEFLEFIEQAQIPVIGGTWVCDNLYTDHKYYFGSSGNVGPRTGNFILQNADVILVLGNSLGYRQTGFNQDNFAPNARIIMIDADENEAKKPGLIIEVNLNIGLKSFFREMQGRRIKFKYLEEWWQYCNMLKEKFTPFEAVDNIKMSDRVCSYYFWQRFREYEPEDSILALGNNTANTAKYQIGVKQKNQRAILNYACGSMGYELPAAVGAAVASGKQIYCITGEGSIMMNLQELQTIRHYNLAVNVVVFSNEGYGSIRQTAKNFFDGVCIGCTPDTGISFPDFAKVADTFGFVYKCCHSNAEVQRCIEFMMKSDKPVFMEILQKLDDPVIPKLMSKMDENGRMMTPALQDMYPFLDRKELETLSYKS